MGACTEEQRLQILQQLQLQAQQGDSQAAAALSNLSSDVAAMTSSPPQVIIQADFDNVALFVSKYLYLICVSRRNLTADGQPLFFPSLVRERGS